MTTQSGPSGLRGCCVLWRWTSQLCKDPGLCCWALVIWIYSLESIDFRYFSKRACPLIIYSSTFSSLVGIFTKSVETWNPRPPASSRLSRAFFVPWLKGPLCRECSLLFFSWCLSLHLPIFHLSSYLLTYPLTLLSCSKKHSRQLTEYQNTRWVGEKWGPV